MKSPVSSTVVVAIVLGDRHLPSNDDIVHRQPVEVFVSPPGQRDTPPADSWATCKIGTAPARVVQLHSHVKARRVQYGLKPFVSSTIHGTMGHPLGAVVTQVSRRNPMFQLWERAQPVVLLSRGACPMYHPICPCAANVSRCAGISCTNVLHPKGPSGVRL